MRNFKMFIALATFLGALAHAQQGNIQGVIFDDLGLLVPYASISIEGTNKGGISDSEGKFLIIDVPAGQQSIKVEYLGFKDQIIPVEVVEGETVELKILLESETQQLEGIILTGFGGGQAKALNTQKNKTNITNIISSDQVGKFPDANVGDAMKRIPGITMQVDQGEARNIIVRGLAPQLNSVTLNGSRIPSAEGDNRNIQMDLIPADMIQAIEVNKAVTPDMDGDALGGSVNLVTRSAPEGFRLSATLGSGVSFITNEANYIGSFILGDRSKNGKFGWMVSASIYDNNFGSDNIEAEWEDEFEFNTGVQDADGEDILESVDVNPYTDVTETRTYLIQRVRRSFSANFDYSFNPNNTIYVKTMYNWRDDRENRYVFAQEILDGDDIELGDFDIDDDGNLVRFPVEAARETKGGIDNNRNKNTRLEDQRMQNYTLGGDHLFGNLKFDWMTSYAKASEERLNERYAQYVFDEDQKYIVRNNNSNPEFPIMTPVDEDAANDLSNFLFDEITEENQYTEEEDINVFLNLEGQADWFNQGDGFWKAGLRGRFKNKFRDNDFFEFPDLEDTFPSMADIPTKDLTDPDFLAGEAYEAGFYPDENWLGALDLRDGEPVPDEFLRANYDVTENVYAGYLMASQKVSEKLLILAGIRVENTDIEATGNQIEDEDDLVGEVTESSNYTNVLPSIHLKYDLNRNTIFRFAWTNTLARPNYEDLVPSVDIVNEDREIYLGNPDLDPTTSMAFDLMAEHYYKNVGILSGGVFYKDIQDFIYTSILEDDATGFDVFQPLNGEGATIFGFEVAYQRQFDFLSGFWRNFSLYLNYTFLTSSTNGVNNEDGDERDDVDLPGTAPNMFNGSLAYNDNRLNIRFSVNYSDAYIDEIGGRAFEDRFYDEQLLMDLNANFAVTPQLRIFLDVNNITNQPLRYFQGVSSRTQQAEYYGVRASLGLKYDLFKRK